MCRAATVHFVREHATIYWQNQKTCHISQDKNAPLSPADAPSAVPVKIVVSVVAAVVTPE